MKPSTYCKNCGAYIPDGKKKCLACGFPIITPPLVSKEDKEWFKEHNHLFKPIDSYTEQRRFSCNGYEINENGQVLSIPDDDEDEIPMTSFDDKMLNIAYSAKLSELERKEQMYESLRQLTDYLLQNTKQEEPKPDIDLDDLMEKTFVTVKINGKITRFYFGNRPQMSAADNGIFGRTIDGRIIGKEITRKIDFSLTEA